MAAWDDDDDMATSAGAGSSTDSDSDGLLGTHISDDEDTSQRSRAEQRLRQNDPQRQAPPSPRVPADKVARAGTPSITAWSIEQVHYAGELRVCLAGTFRSGPFDRGEYKRTSALVRVDHRRVFTRNSTYPLSTPSHTAEHLTKSTQERG